MSRVIKGGSSSTPEPGAPEPSAARVFDARMEAERILKQAQSDAERIRTQASAEGRERGMAAVTELLVGARAAAARARSASVGDMGTLAVRIAQKIIHRELELRPDAITDIVAGVMSGVGAARTVTLRCHPDDLAAIERGRPRLLERCARASALLFRADERVARGGCIVETELATIDARLGTQLEAIERALRGDDQTS